MTRWSMVRALATAGLLVGTGLAGGAGAASASTHSAGSFLMPGGPIIRTHTRGAEPYPTVSVNWSGYAVTAHKGQTFDGVEGTFVQPRITCNGQYTVTSNWVGLDGYTDGTVEQDGTAAYCGGPTHMKPIYYAWIEMFPQPTVAAYPVHPGDYMYSAVVYSGGAFHLKIADETSGLHYTTSAKCSSCERASAEWIIERPASCNATVTRCVILRLADFHTTEMTDDYAQLTGGPVKGPGAFTNYPIDMFSTLRHSPGLISTDEVSSLSGASFAAQWDRAGIPYPITF